MRLVSRVLPLAMLCLAVTGCFQQETVLFLEPDGSGTIEVTTLVSDEITDTMTEMQETFGEGEEPSDDGSPFMGDEGPEKASKMGEGVTFVSADPVKRAGHQGVKAVYAFDDITKIKLDVEPKEPGSEAEPVVEEERDQMVFGFEKLDNGHSILTVYNTALRSDEESAEGEPVMEGADGASEEMGEEALEMLQSLFGDMRISIRVEVAGTLVATNCLFVDGSRLTLMELDFGELFKNPDRLKELGELADPESFAQVTELLKDLPGIKINPVDELRIEFKE